MSEEVKETIKTSVAFDEYEKAKNKFNLDEYSQEEFQDLANLYSESFKDLKEGELIKGRIVRIQGDYIIIDIGFKSEGTISKNEFHEDQVIEVGNEIEVVLESVEDRD